MILSRNGSEWITLGLVLAGLLGAEVTMRGIRGFLSLDIQHLDQTETIVEDLEEADGLRVLLAGNSLLRSGVDPAALEAELEEALGTEVAVGMVYPDGSNPVEWSYLLRKLVIHPQRHLDVVVLAFGPGHLRDRPVERTLLRLAAHHVDGRDVASFLKDDLDDIESRSQFLLARLSNAYALRDRIAPRVMSAIIPLYEELSPILLRAPDPGRVAAGANETGNAGAEAGREAGISIPRSGPTFSYLGRLVSDCGAAEIPVLALPMPALEPYPVDEGALRLFTQSNIPVMGVSFETAFDPERFPDGEHLDPEGMARFTTVLAPAMAAELRDILPN